MTRSIPYNSALDISSIDRNASNVIEAFDERMARDPEWAMTEASKFFEDRGAVQEALQRITSKLTELGIDYAVVGGMALFSYGVRRFTEDVDLLVTRQGLKDIHRQLDGLGYIPPFEKSKNLRDTDKGVRIEFLITGDFPGDGKPKAVSFPNPKDVAVEKNGIRYISLPTLVELKLASGLTNTERLKDLSDVVELVKQLNLSAEFAESLNPYVREKYLELWHAANLPTKRYLLLWRNKWLTADAKSIEEMIFLLQSAASELQAMLADGVTLDPDSGAGDDYAYLVTTDPAIAKKYGMHDEAEFWDENQES